jgi:SAM-dependent methyltransferase
MTSGYSMNYYDSTFMQRLMVDDQTRTQAFARAIAGAVKPGMVVLDVGAGSGILSLFAAQAGAARVYAVERAPGAAAMARLMVADNGFEQVIRVVEGEAEAVWLPERADLLVSEWLGAYGIDENMLAPVLAVRDRWLKPGGAMIPSRVGAWIAPVDHPAGAQALRYSVSAYGLNLAALDPFDRQQAVWLPQGLERECLRTEPQELWNMDCTTLPVEEARRPHAAELEFTLDGAANALAVWFEAEMGDGSRLSNGPGQPRTHWGMLLFPIEAARDAVAGNVLKVGFHNVPAGAYGSHHIWAAGLGEAPREVRDTRLARRAGIEPPWRAYRPEVEETHG